MVLPTPFSCAPRLGVWLPPVGLALGSLLLCGWMVLQPAPGSKTLALLFPPWWGATQSFVAASEAGAVVRFGLLPNIVIIAPARGAARPGATGAWAVLDPQHLGGCGPVGGQNSSQAQNSNQTGYGR